MKLKKLKFSKMHGLGNDFVVIDNLNLRQRLTAQDLKLIADRKFGVGCDQLLMVEPASDGLSDFYYAIFNSDGSVAGQCGNGARCFIAYLIRHGLTAKSELRLQTANRVIKGGWLSGGDYWVNMGPANFSPLKIPLALSECPHYSFASGGRQLSFAALSLGNPHAVIRLANAAELQNDAVLATIALDLQTSGLFPQGVNVNFIHVLSPSLIELRTFERGCGFTLACGSGACAAAVVAIRAGLVNSPVRLAMPGGSLAISYNGTDVLMQGSATHVFDGELELYA